MIYGPAFYKLLGIPESVAEPTAYHLLRVHPRAVTPARIDEALRRQKARLRSSIPGPQFIPLVAQIERELEAAAETLRDPARRAEYNRRLRQRAAGKPSHRADRDRARLVAACRRAVREMTDLAGCLPAASRPLLARRLAELGLPADQVRYVLDNLPAPPAEERPDRPTDEPDEQTLEFFRQAIDLEIEDGRLDEKAEERLIQAARRCGMDPDRARQIIDRRLAERGARRGADPARAAEGQFKLQLLAMFPLGDATEADRKRLLALAAAEGIPVRRAEAILEEYLPASESTAAPGELPFDEAQWAELESLADGQAASAPQKAPASPPAARRWAIDLAVGVLLAAAAIAAWQLLGPYTRPSVSRPPQPGDEPPAPADARRGGGSPGLDPAGKLLARSFAAVRRPDALRDLFRDASPAVRHEALRQAADLLLTGQTIGEQLRAEWLFRGLLSCPPSPAAVQNSAVDALISRLAAAVAAGPLDRAAYRPVALLANVMFLRAPPGFDVTDPGGMKAFLAACSRAWQASGRDSPDDPANDPRRLAAAVLDGGSLALYAQRADRPRFAAVTGELARIAADPARPGSQAALETLLAAAGRTTWPAPLRAAARLALCDVLAEARGPFVAGRAHATLVSLLALPFDHPLRGTPVASADERRAAADALRKLLAPPPATATAVAAATAPASAPAASRPARPADSLAQRLAASWTDANDTRALLTDLAAEALACSARIARFAGDPDPLNRRLLGALAEKDPALRAARLTRGVELPDLDAFLAAGTASTLDKSVAEKLARDLRNHSPGVRYAAIERLAVLDGPAAADVLLRRLGELVRAAGREYPEMNRILRALVGINDPAIPNRLAELIQPARTNYAAHRIVITLLDGTGLAGSTERPRYELPPVHNAARRAQAAELWKALAASSPWGSQRIIGSVAGFSGPPAAWKPDPATQKLLAVFVHQVELSARMLRAYRPLDPAETPPPTAAEAARVKAPVGNADLAGALELLTTQLTRLARSHRSARSCAVALDMIALTDTARMLACRTELQRAAVRLDTAGKLLEVLVRQADDSPATRAAVEQSRRRRRDQAAAARNVLAEMRTHCHHNLLLLGLLPAGGP